VVERSFARLSRRRRSNIIVERSKDRLIAFVSIAYIFISARRPTRRVAEDLCAWPTTSSQRFVRATIAIQT
jgi:hypothetical protein